MTSRKLAQTYLSGTLFQKMEKELLCVMALSMPTYFGENGLLESVNFYKKTHNTMLHPTKNRFAVFVG